MKTVTFIFGAGAEGKGNYNLPNGYEYLKETVFINSLDDVYKNLFSFIKDNKYFENEERYYKHTNDTCNINEKTLEKFIFSYLESLRTSENDINLDKNIKIEIEEKLNKAMIEKISREFNLQLTVPKEKTKNILLDEFKEILLNDKYKYNLIKSNLLQKIFQEKDGKAYCDLNIGISSILDNYFHTVNNPKKYGPVNFSKLFNYYWSCYFCIVKAIITNTSIDNKKIIEEYLKNDILDCKKVLENIKDFTSKIYSFKHDEKMTTYYKLIKSKMDEEKLIPQVITTNYYNFVEILGDPKTAYLNGSLKMFEIPELLKVTDFNDEDIDFNKFLVFPFIFGQSLIKPIVSSYQIEQFSLAIEKLKDSNVLVILGYGINEDDNHVNSIIREAILKFNYDKIIIVTNDLKQNILKYLRLGTEEKNIDIVDYEAYDRENRNSLVVDRIFELINNKNHLNKSSAE